MGSDPTNEAEEKRSARGALAGFPLPLPDTSVPAWTHPPTPHPSAAARQARCSALDAVLGGGGGGGGAVGNGAVGASGEATGASAGAADDDHSDANGRLMSSDDSIKAGHLERWKHLQSETAAMHAAKNAHNLRRYAASVGIISRE